MSDVSYQKVKAVVSDEQGNVYVVGEYGGAPDFDAGPATMTIPCTGYHWMFLAKYSNNGNLLLLKTLDPPTGTGIEVMDITLDEDGQLFVLGYFSGTIDFDPGLGSHELTAAATTAVFIAKYDLELELLSGVAIQNSGDGVTGQYIACDGAGGVYIAGTMFYWGPYAQPDTQIDFDPGIDSLIVPLVDADGTDLFLVHYDADYHPLFAYSLGTVGCSDALYDLVTDDAGAAYMAYRSCTWGGTANLFAKLRKVSSMGTTIWERTIEDTSSEIEITPALKLAYGGAEFIYLTGQSANLVTEFDGENSGGVLTSETGTAFIVAYDTANNFQFCRPFATDLEFGFSSCTAIHADTSGRVFVGGSFEGELVDFDPGVGVVSVSSVDVGINDHMDGFLLMLTVNGGYLDMVHFPGSGYFESADITTTPDGVVLGGAVYGNYTLDEDELVLAAPDEEYDGFATKYGFDASSQQFEVPSAHGSLRLVPNPAQQFVRVVLNDRVEDLRILDARGQLVFSSSGPIDNPIDVSNYDAGAYTLVVLTAQGSAAARLMVIR